MVSQSFSNGNSSKVNSNGDTKKVLIKQLADTLRRHSYNTTPESLNEGTSISFDRSPKTPAMLGSALNFYNADESCVEDQTIDVTRNLSFSGTRDEGIFPNRPNKPSPRIQFALDLNHDFKYRDLCIPVIPHLNIPGQTIIADTSIQKSSCSLFETIHEQIQNHLLNAIRECSPISVENSKFESKAIDIMGKCPPERTSTGATTTAVQGQAFLGVLTPTISVVSSRHDKESTAAFPGKQILSQKVNLQYEGVSRQRPEGNQLKDQRMKMYSGSSIILRQHQADCQYKICPDGGTLGESVLNTAESIPKNTAASDYIQRLRELEEYSLMQEKSNQIPLPGANFPLEMGLIKGANDQQLFSKSPNPFFNSQEKGFYPQIINQGYHGPGLQNNDKLMAFTEPNNGFIGDLNGGVFERYADVNMSQKTVFTHHVQGMPTFSGKRNNLGTSKLNVTQNGRMMQTKICSNSELSDLAPPRRTSVARHINDVPQGKSKIAFIPSKKAQVLGYKNEETIICANKIETSKERGLRNDLGENCYKDTLSEPAFNYIAGDNEFEEERTAWLNRGKEIFHGPPLLENPSPKFVQHLRRMEIQRERRKRNARLICIYNARLKSQRDNPNFAFEEMFDQWRSLTRPRLEDKLDSLLFQLGDVLWPKKSRAQIIREMKRENQRIEQGRYSIQTSAASAVRSSEFNLKSWKQSFDKSSFDKKPRAYKKPSAYKMPSVDKNEGADKNQSTAKNSRVDKDSKTDKKSQVDNNSGVDKRRNENCLKATEGSNKIRSTAINRSSARPERDAKVLKNDKVDASKFVPTRLHFKSPSVTGKRSPLEMTSSLGGKNGNVQEEILYEVPFKPPFEMAEHNCLSSSIRSADFENIYRRKSSMKLCVKKLVSKGTDELTRLTVEVEEPDECEAEFEAKTNETSEVDFEEASESKSKIYLVKETIHEAELPETPNCGGDGFSLDSDYARSTKEYMLIINCNMCREDVMDMPTMRETCFEERVQHGAILNKFGVSRKPKPKRKPIIDKNELLRPAKNFAGKLKNVKIPVKPRSEVDQFREKYQKAKALKKAGVGGQVFMKEIMNNENDWSDDSDNCFFERNGVYVQNLQSHFSAKKNENDLALRIKSAKMPSENAKHITNKDNENVSTENNENIPTKNMENTQAKGNKNIPKKTNENILTKDNKNIPPKQDIVEQGKTIAECNETMKIEVPAKFQVEISKAFNKSSKSSHTDSKNPSPSIPVGESISAGESPNALNVKQCNPKISTGKVGAVPTVPVKKKAMPPKIAKPSPPKKPNSTALMKKDYSRRKNESNSPFGSSMNMLCRTEGTPISEMVDVGKTEKLRISKSMFRPELNEGTPMIQVKPQFKARPKGGTMNPKPSIKDHEDAKGSNALSRVNLMCNTKNFKNHTDIMNEVITRITKRMDEEMAEISESDLFRKRFNKKLEKTLEQLSCDEKQAKWEAIEWDVKTFGKGGVVDSALERIGDVPSEDNSHNDLSKKKRSASIHKIKDALEVVSSALESHRTKVQNSHIRPRQQPAHDLCSTDRIIHANRASDKAVDTILSLTALSSACALDVLEGKRVRTGFDDIGTVPNNVNNLKDDLDHDARISQLLKEANERIEFNSQWWEQVADALHEEELEQLAISQRSTAPQTMRTGREWLTGNQISLLERSPTFENIRMQIRSQDKTAIKEGLVALKNVFEERVAATEQHKLDLLRYAEQGIPGVFVKPEPITVSPLQKAVAQDVFRRIGEVCKFFVENDTELGDNLMHGGGPAMGREIHTYFPECRNQKGNFANKKTKEPFKVIIEDTPENPNKKFVEGKVANLRPFCKKQDVLKSMMEAAPADAAPLIKLVSCEVLDRCLNNTMDKQDQNVNGEEVSDKKGKSAPTNEQQKRRDASSNRRENGENSNVNNPNLVKTQKHPTDAVRGSEKWNRHPKNENGKQFHSGNGIVGLVDEYLEKRGPTPYQMQMLSKTVFPTQLAEASSMHNVAAYHVTHDTEGNQNRPKRPNRESPDNVKISNAERGRAIPFHEGAHPDAKTSVPGPPKISVPAKPPPPAMGEDRGDRRVGELVNVSPRISEASFANSENGRRLPSTIVRDLKSYEKHQGITYDEFGDGRRGRERAPRRRSNPRLNEIMEKAQDHVVQGIDSRFLVPTQNANYIRGKRTSGVWFQYTDRRKQGFEFAQRDALKGEKFVFFEDKSSGAYGKERYQSRRIGGGDQPWHRLSKSMSRGPEHRSRSLSLRGLRSYSEGPKGLGITEREISKKRSSSHKFRESKIPIIDPLEFKPTPPKKKLLDTDWAKLGRPDPRKQRQKEMQLYQEDQRENLDVIDKALDNVYQAVIGGPVTPSPRSATPQPLVAGRQIAEGLLAFGSRGVPRVNRRKPRAIYEKGVAGKEKEYSKQPPPTYPTRADTIKLMSDKKLDMSKIRNKYANDDLPKLTPEELAHLNMISEVESVSKFKGNLLDRSGKILQPAAFQKLNASKHEKDVFVETSNGRMADTNVFKKQPPVLKDSGFKSSNLLNAQPAVQPTALPQAPPLFLALPATPTELHQAPKSPVVSHAAVLRSGVTQIAVVAKAPINSVVKANLVADESRPATSITKKAASAPTKSTKVKAKQPKKEIFISTPAELEKMSVPPKGPPTWGPPRTPLTEGEHVSAVVSPYASVTQASPETIPYQMPPPLPPTCTDIRIGIPQPPDQIKSFPREQMIKRSPREQMIKSSPREQMKMKEEFMGSAIGWRRDRGEFDGLWHLWMRGDFLPHEYAAWNTPDFYNFPEANKISDGDRLPQKNEMWLLDTDFRNGVENKAPSGLSVSMMAIKASDMYHAGLLQEKVPLNNYVLLPYGNAEQLSRTLPDLAPSIGIENIDSALVAPMSQRKFQETALEAVDRSNNAFDDFWRALNGKKDRVTQYREKIEKEMKMKSSNITNWTNIYHEGQDAWLKDQPIKSVTQLRTKSSTSITTNELDNEADREKCKKTLMTPNDFDNEADCEKCIKYSGLVTSNDFRWGVDRKIQAQRSTFLTPNDFDYDADREKARRLLECLWNEIPNPNSN